MEHYLCCVNRISRSRNSAKNVGDHQQVWGWDATLLRQHGGVLGDHLVSLT